MSVVDARIFPTPTIQYYQSSKEHQFRPKDGNLLIHVLYIEHPNNRPPILRANSYRRYLYAKIKRVGDTIIGVATQRSYYFDSADISHPNPGGSNHPSSVALSSRASRYAALVGESIEEYFTEMVAAFISHAGLLGTSRPTHNHGLYDENGFDANITKLNFTHAASQVVQVSEIYYAQIAQIARDFIAHLTKFHTPTFGSYKGLYIQAIWYPMIYIYYDHCVRRPFHFILSYLLFTTFQQFHEELEI
ncbi:unnamed protein product [Rhizophagus irregularis]|nr:unnamed protein product [Rhizophagus irregularis]